MSENHPLGNAKTQEREQVLSLTKIYVKDYTQRTQDFSVLATHYHRPIGDWAPNQLNQGSLQRLYTHWEKTDPEKAKALDEAIKIFKRTDLLPDGISDIRTLQVEVAKIEEATDKINALITPELKKLEEQERSQQPLAWMRDRLERTTKNIKAGLANTNFSEQLKFDLKGTVQALAKAKKSKDQKQIARLSYKLRFIQFALEKNKQALTAQLTQYLTDLKDYHRHMKKLDLLGPNGQPPLYPQITKAEKLAKKYLEELKGLDTKDLTKMLTTLRGKGNQIAALQGVLLKGLSFSNSALAQGIRLEPPVSGKMSL